MKLKKNRLNLTLWLGCFCGVGLVHVRAWSALIAVPSVSLTNNNGNSEFRPFDSAQPARFQQVYNATAFASLAAAGGGYIREFDFRVDAPLGHPFAGVNITNLQINISTTSRSADELSPIFDDNIGLDDALVLGPGSVRITSNGGGGFSYFDVSFGLSQPFFYDPAMGSLLLDFRVHQGIGNLGLPQGVAVLDAYAVMGDHISSVFASGPTPPTSGEASTLGLATLFVVTPVPEPSSILLTAVGLLFMGGIGWKRMGRRKEAKHGTA